MYNIQQFDNAELQEELNTNILKDMDPAKHLSLEDIQKHVNKPVRGFGVITDNDGNQLSEPNLVVLGGREYVAHMIAGKRGPVNFPEIRSNVNLLTSKIRYFGIGNGAQQESSLDKIGLTYSNDIELSNPIKIGEGNVGADENYKYIHDGYLKRIESDKGTIEILEEDHLISIGLNKVTVQANTTIKFTMYILPGELNNYPETFNEAALYSIEMQDSESEIPYGISDEHRSFANKRLFAKFTTLNKYLASKDGIRIEWYILT